jgi:hypothetical protein
MRTRFRITSVDYEPEDLSAQVPFDGVLLRKLADPDRPDYWLAELLKPLEWNDDGVARRVAHLVLAARYERETIQPGFQRLMVGLAYVTDDTLLSDSQLAFAKCRYVAIGVAEGGNGHGATSSTGHAHIPD